MLKQSLLILAAAGLISIAVPFARRRIPSNTSNPRLRRRTVDGITVRPIPPSARPN